MNTTQQTHRTTLTEDEMPEPQSKLPEQPTTEKPGELLCPKCGGTSLRESETRRRADFLPGLSGKTALRCRTCQERFHAKLPKLAPGAVKKKRDRKNQEPFWQRPEGRRKFAQVGVFCISIIVFAGFLLFLTTVGNN